MNNKALNNNLSATRVKEKNLPYWFKALLCKTVEYFNGDLYRFVLNPSNELYLTLADKTTKPLIIIYARAYYNESAKNYPVESNSELKKLLSLEFGLSENTFYHAWGGNKGQSQVNLWEFSLKVPDSFIKIPESLVLAQVINEGEVLLSDALNNKECLLYVASNKKLIHSLLQTPIMNSATRFSMATGLPMLRQEVTLNKEQLPQQFGYGLMKVKPNVLFSFMKKIDSKNSLFILKKIAFPMLAVSFIYLLLTSVFLVYKQNALENQLSEKTEQVSAALQQQQAFDKNLTRYQALKQFTTKQRIRSGLWLLMVDVFPKARITNVRIVDDRYVIRGTIDKATDLLEQISNNANAKNAKFDFPTRKGRGVEVFVISFELSDEAYLEHQILSNKSLVSARKVIHG